MNTVELTTLYRENCQFCVRREGAVCTRYDVYITSAVIRWCLEEKRGEKRQEEAG